jgi:hypothetical protein
VRHPLLEPFGFEALLELEDVPASVNTHVGNSLPGTCAASRTFGIRRSVAIVTFVRSV